MAMQSSATKTLIKLIVILPTPMYIARNVHACITFEVLIMTIDNYNNESKMCYIEYIVTTP